MNRKLNQRPLVGLNAKGWWNNALSKTRRQNGLLQPRWIHKNALVGNTLRSRFFQEIPQPVKTFRAYATGPNAKKVVICFRLTRADESALRERLAEMGVDSTRKLCRKIVVDYLDGKMERRDTVTGETCPLP